MICYYIFIGHMGLEKMMFDMDISMRRTENNSAICELDLLDITNRRKVIEAITQGNIVAGHMRHVYGLWIDANNTKTREDVSVLKGEPVGKKMSIMMTGDSLLPHIDTALIYEPLRKFVEDPDMYSSVFGSICHTVLPLNPQSSDYFPDSVKSQVVINGSPRDIVYNLDPTGHIGIEELIKDLEYAQVVPAVTSMNPSSYPEIISHRDALKFLKERQDLVQIPIIFRDSKVCRSDIVGSFPQLNLLNGKIIRDGHIPAKILSWMFSVEEDETIKDAKYRQNLFEIQLPLLPERNNPQDIRKTILDYIYISEEKI